MEQHRQESYHPLMRQPLRKLAVVAGLLTSVLLAGCADNKPAPVTSSRPTPVTTAKMGTYKVGKPYQIEGTWYYPEENYNYSEEGVSSWYGPDFHGKLTANGETYDMNDLTAAHRTLPMPCVVRVTNLENGRSMVVRVNDRGPFAKNRIIDVSRRTAELLGFHMQGTTRVRVEILGDESRALKAQAMANSGDMPAVQAAPRQTVVSQSLEGENISAPVSISVSASAPALSTSASSSGASVSRRVSAPSVAVSRGEASWVQAGAFSEKGNAERLRQKLQGVGNASVSPVTVAGKPVYRVRLGPLSSPSEAERVLSAVRSRGVTGAKVVSDD